MIADPEPQRALGSEAAGDSPIRAVLDANVVASALVKPSGTPGQILELLLSKAAFESIVSEHTLAELRRCVTYARLRKYIRLTDAELEQWIEYLMIVSTVVEDEPFPNPPVVVADPDDDLYLTVAATGRALYVVTGDRELHAIGIHEGIAVISPSQFLGLIAGKQEAL